MINCLISWYRGKEQLLQYNRVDVATLLKMLCLLSSWRYVAALLLYWRRREPPSFVLCGTWPQSLMAGKTTLMLLKSPRGFRKLFMDHRSKRSKMSVEDKTGCEHFTTGVWIWGASGLIFLSLALSSSRLSGLRVWHHAGIAAHTAHATPACHNLSAGKLQKLTSKSKVHCQNQTVSRTPNKNHWSPHSCDEEKQLRLQSQHHFLSFSTKRAHSQLLPCCRS